MTGTAAGIIAGEATIGGDRMAGGAGMIAGVVITDGAPTANGEVGAGIIAGGAITGGDRGNTDLLLMAWQPRHARLFSCPMHKR